MQDLTAFTTLLFFTEASYCQIKVLEMQKIELVKSNHDMRDEIQRITQNRNLFKSELQILLSKLDGKTISQEIDSIHRPIQTSRFNHNTPATIVYKAETSGELTQTSGAKVLLGPQPRVER